MKIMAIDYGDAHTGVAFSDPTGFLTGTTTTIHSRNADVVLSELARLVREQAALSPRQRLARRQSVSKYSRRYGPREFTHSVLSVYDRAILEHPRSR